MKEYEDDTGDDELDSIRQAHKFEQAIDKIEIEDALYQWATIERFGLRTWFKAARFTSIDEANDLLRRAIKVLEKHEEYEKCATILKHDRWLSEKSKSIDGDATKWRRQSASESINDDRDTK